MPPITDLSWNQLNAAVVARTGQQAISFDAYGLPSVIDIGAIIDAFPMIQVGSTDEEAGVIRFMAVLYDCCRDAQQAVNLNQPAGEKLNAFPSPTTQAPVGTLVPIVRTLNTRADLTSVSKVVGANS